MVDFDGWYRLDADRQVVPLLAGEQRTEGEDKRVARTDLPNGYRVLTVFLGLDHRFGPSHAAPLVFETMVFPRDSFSDVDGDRYCTWAEAAAGHQALVDKWAAMPQYEAQS